MKRELQHEDVIDLGAASVETKGPTFGHDDSRSGLIPVTGLNDE